MTGLCASRVGERDGREDGPHTVGVLACLDLVAKGVEGHSEIMKQLSRLMSCDLWEVKPGEV